MARQLARRNSNLNRRGADATTVGPALVAIHLPARFAIAPPVASAEASPPVLLLALWLPTNPHVLALLSERTQRAAVAGSTQ